ncbi:4'-phosphopantetheinyl transferase family protein [Clostridium boliviensis]|uniref:4'-phosphopantetheinyl transferase family protein n=1 Tax=Clostridium boliviensis TaxID=318465 RepID=UPI0029653D21|nr:4'-phosphopantetheinyl transferase superfamily protein [Clostridium boliviensis]
MYLADLDACRAVSEIPYENYLSEEEKERLKLITIPQSRNRVMLRRSLTRMIISSYLNYFPGKIQFYRNSYGKPSVLEPVTDLKFNLSHCGKYLILIADRNREVGIDIETAHSFQKRKYEIMESLYSPEESACYQSLPARKQYQMFCRTWVMKEAVIKALSLGLTADLTKISLPADVGLSCTILPLDFYNAVLKIQWITREDNQIAIAYREEEI